MKSVHRPMAAGPSHDEGAEPRSLPSSCTAIGAEHALRPPRYSTECLEAFHRKGRHTDGARTSFCCGGRYAPHVAHRGREGRCCSTILDRRSAQSGRAGVESFTVIGDGQLPCGTSLVVGWDDAWNPLLEGVVAPRAHRVRTAATISGQTPVHHPKMHHPPQQPMEPEKI